MGLHCASDETASSLLHAFLRDEKVVLVHVDLDARLAAVKVLERLGAVLPGKETFFVSTTAL